MSVIREIEELERISKDRELTNAGLSWKPGSYKISSWGPHAYRITIYGVDDDSVYFCYKKALIRGLKYWGIDRKDFLEVLTLCLVGA